MTRLNAAHFGEYRGDGVWRDDSGDTHAYRVTLTLERRDGGIGLSFLHEFTEEPGTDDVRLDITMTESAAPLLRFDLGPVSGRGYQSEATLHYDIPLPGNAIEATYVFDGSGGCLVLGSAESNAAGRHIMWTETLRRV